MAYLQVLASLKKFISPLSELINCKPESCKKRLFSLFGEKNNEHIAFFENKEISDCKCKLLAENFSQAIEWEKLSVSKYSPGIVGDKETIARQIFSPIHIDDETGDIKTAAFDDSLNKGLSVNRLSYSDNEDIHALGENKAKNDRERKPEREYIGFATAKVSKIRQHTEGSKRVFTVYDTALKEVVHHADLCIVLLNSDDSQEPKLPKKAAKKARRLKLKREFSELIKTAPSIK